jgi:peptidoglycan/xylan/chitin deacetylase (PgdA/CDA1 family)
MRAVLMFHGVDDSGSVLSITSEQLSSLIRAVRRSGHDIVPLSTLLGSSTPNSVALTFDDGFASVAERAAPLLGQLAVPATLFLTTERVGLDNRWPSQPSNAPLQPMMSWSDVQSLARAGWTIEAHSASHPDLRQLADAELTRELQTPCTAIERHTGRRPRGLAYPYGYFDARVAERARADFEFAVTTVFRTLSEGEDPMRVPRLDSYYFRSRHVHAHFGTARFMAYLTARGAARRFRKHPGEITR